MNNRICKAAVALSLLAAGHASALEVTGHNDIRAVNSGLEQRLEANTAAMTSVINNMKSRVDAAEADLTLIKANGAKDEVQRWNTKLEARLDDIEASLASLTTYINTIMTNGKNNEVNKWNPKMEARFDAIEADITDLKNKPAAEPSIKVTSSGTVAEGSSKTLTADYCALNTAIFSTTADNHSHTCQISKSGSQYTVTAATAKASTDCSMICFTFQ